MDFLLLLLLLLLQFWEGSFSPQKQTFELCVSGPVTVQEGLCVAIPCSFHYPSEYRNNDPGYAYWYQKKSGKLVATNKPHMTIHPGDKDRFHFIGNPQMDNCSLRITGAKKSDAGDYEFRIEKGALSYSYSKHRVSLQVVELTEKPEIHMPEILEPGKQVTLTCVVPEVCRNASPVTFLWQGTALSSQGLASQNTNSSKLLFTPWPQDNNTNITCQVKLAEATMSTETTIQLTPANKGSPRSSHLLETVNQSALVLSILATVLFTCLVTCLVKRLRRKPSDGDVGGSESGISTNQVSSVVPLNQHENSTQHASPEIPPAIVLTPCLQEWGDEVQYASISTQAQKPQKIYELEDTNTEYSELKFETGNWKKGAGPADQGTCVLVGKGKGQEAWVLAL
ncbi:myeloid cell surface antigen CD33-like [Dromiciops gliroides]|uniref:myeloid cell surface antigen CD33-like n=1 Tax=Dromiciops gliroides TaxID=33562 RepID=UPI001CC3A048|nr:myeloid cell surface antigen CD33-like [Dromiciops gliroides]